MTVAMKEGYFRWLWVFCLFPGCLLAATPAPDGFLDSAIPPGALPDPPPAPEPGTNTSSMVEFDSYAARMENLRAALPRPIVFPDGLGHFIREKDLTSDWSKGKTFFIDERVGEALFPGSTLRDLLNLSTRDLGLTWKFDAARNEIVTDFSWRCDDFRTSAELVHYLTSTRPGPTGPISKGLDPWQTAFNALLSKPENFSLVWPLRFSADDRLFMFFASPRPINNLVAGAIHDDQGASHFLFVNNQEEFFNPGPPGSISYYLFDSKGRFESGGIRTIGYRCFGNSAWLDADGRRLWVRVYNNGSQRRDSIFAIEKGALVSKDFLIEGLKPTNWQLSGLDEGSSIFTVKGK